MDRRPLGVTIVGWLNLVAGIVILATQSPYLLEPGQVRETLTAIGSTVPLYLYQTGLISIARALCGIGMLRGESWSWWLEVFLEANIIVISVYSIVVVGSSFPLLYYFKQVLPLVIAIVIIAYLFRQRTMSFFHIEKPVTASILGIVFGANLVTVILLGSLRV